jgi:hypothetical protein
MGTRKLLEEIEGAQELTPNQLKAYLDIAIDKWRVKKETATTPNEELIAACYVDAYQSVRVSAFGELKPPEKD